MLVALQYLVLAGVAVGIGVVAYSVLRLPRNGLVGPFDVRVLGRIEGSLPDLKRVIVIADQIEDPEDELRRAVKHNFQKGVHYLFLISKSRAPQELDRYVKIFMTLAEIITKKTTWWRFGSFPTIGLIIPTSSMRRFRLPRQELLSSPSVVTSGAKESPMNTLVCHRTSPIRLLSRFSQGRQRR